MKHRIFTLGLSAALLSAAVTSCDDFLDKDPSKNALKTFETVDQLDAMLATYTQFYQETNSTFLGTDDYALTPALMDYKTSATKADDLNDMTWAGVNDRSTSLWSLEYTKILQANMALALLDKVDGTPADKARVKAEAHMVRAYSNLQLAVCYCLHPAAGGNEPGLPLKRTNSFEEPVARGTLAQTMAFIEADILEAVKTDKPLVNPATGDKETWRASRAGANALAARFYLYLNDYAKAATYAGEALKDYSEVRDLADPAQMKYSPYSPENVTVDAGTDRQQRVSLMFPHPNDPIEYGYWQLLFQNKDLLYARTMYHDSGWFIPSRGLLDTYARDIKDADPDNDLRYHYFMCEGYSVRSNCRQVAEALWPGYMQYYWNDLVSGPTTAEMMLIKAEALARQGDAAGAMALVNELRLSRIAASAYTKLTAADKAQALSKVMDERRREMPFTMRWYDLKRYNANDDPSDDVTVSHPFYPYTASAVQTSDPVVEHRLEPGSRRWAMPLPDIDILRSEGQLVQNRY